MAQEDNKQYLRSLLDIAISSETCETVNFRALRQLLAESIERCCDGTSDAGSKKSGSSSKTSVKQRSKSGIRRSKSDITSGSGGDEETRNISLVLKNVDDHLALTVELPKGGVCINEDELDPCQCTPVAMKTDEEAKAVSKSDETKEKVKQRRRSSSLKPKSDSRIVAQKGSEIGKPVAKKTESSLSSDSQAKSKSPTLSKTQKTTPIDSKIKSLSEKSAQKQPSDGLGKNEKTKPRLSDGAKRRGSSSQKVEPKKQTEQTAKSDKDGKKPSEKSTSDEKKKSKRIEQPASDKELAASGDKKGQPKLSDGLPKRRTSMAQQAIDGKKQSETSSLDEKKKLKRTEQLASDKKMATGSEKSATAVDGKGQTKISDDSPQSHTSGPLQAIDATTKDGKSGAAADGGSSEVKDSMELDKPLHNQPDKSASIEKFASMNKAVMDKIKEIETNFGSRDKKSKEGTEAQGEIETSSAVTEHDGSSVIDQSKKIEDSSQKIDTEGKIKPQKRDDEQSKKQKTDSSSEKKESEQRIGKKSQSKDETPKVGKKDIGKIKSSESADAKTKPKKQIHDGRAKADDDRKGEDDVKTSGQLESGDKALAQQTRPEDAVESATKDDLDASGVPKSLIDNEFKDSSEISGDVESATESSKSKVDQIQPSDVDVSDKKIEKKDSKLLMKVSDKQTAKSTEDSSGKTKVKGGKKEDEQAAKEQVDMTTGEKIHPKPGTDDMITDRNEQGMTGDQSSDQKVDSKRDTDGDKSVTDSEQTDDGIEIKSSANGAQTEQLITDNSKAKDGKDQTKKSKSPRQTKESPRKGSASSKRSSTSDDGAKDSKSMQSDDKMKLDSPKKAKDPKDKTKSSTQSIEGEDSSSARSRAGSKSSPRSRTGSQSTPRKRTESKSSSKSRDGSKGTPRSKAESKVESKSSPRIGAESKSSPRSRDGSKGVSKSKAEGTKSPRSRDETKKSPRSKSGSKMSLKLRDGSKSSLGGKTTQKLGEKTDSASVRTRVTPKGDHKVISRSQSRKIRPKGMKSWMRQPETIEKSKKVSQETINERLKRIKKSRHLLKSLLQRSELVDVRHGLRKRQWHENCDCNALENTNQCKCDSEVCLDETSKRKPYICFCAASFLRGEDGSFYHSACNCCGNN